MQDRDDDNEEDLGVGWSFVRHVGCEPVPEWTEVTEAQQSVEQAEKEQIVRDIKEILELFNKDTKSLLNTLRIVKKSLNILC